jgi:CRISPR-associated endoribonuclease Cas6
MRLKCEYKTESLPVAHRMLWVSLIKESLKKVNAYYYNRLYNYEGKNNKKIKNFSFSIFMKDFKMNGDLFEIKDKVIFNITTNDYEFGINLYNGLLNMNDFQYKSFYLNKLKISLVKESFINSSEVVLKTLSPICIKDKNNNFLSPEDGNYIEELNYITNTALNACRGYGLKEPIGFQPVSMKKVVVKENIRAFTDITNKTTFYVNAYSGIFKLTGDIEDLNFIYQCGLGHRRSQGFGMIDIV